MNQTGIQWTDKSWNPFAGCEHVSEGCRNCYAERHANRFRGMAGYPADNPFKVTLHPHRLEQPLTMKTPQKIFVGSMGDLFHKKIPFEYICKVYETMARAHWHTFQVLTKRPERALEFYRWLHSDGRHPVSRIMKNSKTYMGRPWPLPNVWFGVSPCDQATLERYWQTLRQIPAVVRWLSLEPLLGPVDLSRIGRVDWVVAGGESGAQARPAHPDFFRKVRDDCQDMRVPFFFKQWGEWRPSMDVSNELGHDNWSAPFTHINCRGETDENIFTLESYDGTSYGMARVGKKKAGRNLDGREWNEFPKVG